MMHTIRRLYLYVVAFLSLEAVLWGTIGLLRSLFAGEPQAGSTVRLAGSLSMILVGLPLFLFHGWLVQRGAARHTLERSARIRAISLHGILLATLLPALLNLLALLNRGLLSFFGANPARALVGGGQTGLDNLVAIVTNLLAAALVFLLLSADVRKPVHGEAFVVSRRLYRLLWLLIGLVFFVFGFRQLLQFAFDLLVSGIQGQDRLANGLSLILIGVPLWFFVSYLIQRSLADPAEQRSSLRLSVMYALAFAGLSVLLFSTVLILESLVRELPGAFARWPELLDEVRTPLVNALSLGAVWAYYLRQLQAERKSETPPAVHVTLHRLYRAVFAFLGLVAAFAGLRVLLEIGLLSVLAGTSPPGEPSGASLARALAWLLVGLPVWFIGWRNMQVEVSGSGEAGLHARRSPVRKAYLYGILFLSIVGATFSTGQLVFPLLQSTLGTHSADLLQNSLLRLKDILLFTLSLAYHGWVLRRDGRLVEQALVKRRALYPVLLLVSGEGDFAERLVTALEHHLPGLPVAVHPASSGAPDESLSTAKAVILPFELLARPAEALRLWLQSFPGERLVVPSPVEHWHWLAGSWAIARDPVDWSVRAIQDLVEGSWPPAD